MSAITSYLRHLIVTGLLVLLEKLKLPLEGAQEFANAVALFLIGTLTWLFTKYGPSWAKAATKKKSRLPLFLVAIIPCFAFVSCGTVVSEYTVNGAGRDWVSQPIQTLPASRVAPTIDIPAGWTGGYKLPPISIAPQK